VARASSVCDPHHVRTSEGSGIIQRFPRAKLLRLAESRSPSAPTGLCPKAQGCRNTATLGNRSTNRPTATRLRLIRSRSRVWPSSQRRWRCFYFRTCTQGRQMAADSVSPRKGGSSIDSLMKATLNKAGFDGHTVHHQSPPSAQSSRTLPKENLDYVEQPGTYEATRTEVEHDAAHLVGRKLTDGTVRQKSPSYWIWRRLGDHPVESWRADGHRGVCPMRKGRRPAIPHTCVLPGAARERRTELNRVSGIGVFGRPRERQTIRRGSDSRNDWLHASIT